jgi:hypothetical protein
VDVRLELANLVFPTGLSGDASIVRLLETDANSVGFCDIATLRTERKYHRCCLKTQLFEKNGACSGLKLELSALH